MDPDAAWHMLESWLGQRFEIDGIFYGVYPVGAFTTDFPLVMERGIIKMTYAEDFLAALNGNPLVDDRVSELVLSTARPCFWHHDDILAGATEKQLKRAELDARYGMDVGVSVPLLTPSGRVCGGFGLRHRGQDAAVFDRMMDAGISDLVRLLHAFESLFRGPYARQCFGLSTQEVRVLTYIAGGMAIAQTGWEIQLSPKTVEAYLASVRRKTRSRSTAEAVAKAIFFQII
ncbi:hypothetical protein CSC94_02150 [Zhengella mangrovi]|uniref:HTH luxR-type domain-containing protein n=1 Tax=Zhengella mangrovi TaxID=1982044 RepID=A0A2G1QTE1_9HYPH|nr:LuxR family transcriptional regulator [Zhengella mangrovi]PHP68816.1 hypothetical protein CSC94_02150 [Zhengella mangrovi]